MHACVLLVATAALLISSSVVTAAPVSAATAPTLTLNTVGTRDCTATTAAPGGKVPASVTFDTVQPESYKPLNGNGGTIDTTDSPVAGTGSTVTTTFLLDAPSLGAYQQTLEVTAQSAYNPSNVVTVDVPACLSANHPPVAVDDKSATTSGVPVQIDIEFNDSDPDGDRISATGLTHPGQGTATIDAADIVTYTSGPDFVGTDTFMYTISDTHGATATATVTVKVNAPTPPSIPVPVARLALSPSSGAVPLIVHADGSASTVGSGFVSYTYVWGDGQIDVSNSPIASHTYPQGRFTMALVVVNEAGHSIVRQIVYSLPRTPRVFANETLTQGRAAIAAIHVAVGNTVYPAGHGATPPAGYKYVVSAFALQKRTSTGYSYTSLAAGQLIPYGSVVAVRLKLVLK